MSANQDSAEDAQDEFASGGDYFDDEFDSGDETGGTAGPGEQGGDTIDPDTGEFTGGGSDDDDDDDPGLDQTPSFADGAAGGNDPGAPTERADETPGNSGRSSAPATDDDDSGGREPSTDAVPDVDGRKTRLSGEDAPGNPNDQTTGTVLDEAGDEGERVFPEDDDPLVVDDGRGLEDQGVGGVPTAAGVEQEARTPPQEARADAVERLQSRVDREVPGVSAIDTDAYNIVPADDGGLRVELTDTGVDQVREATAAEADREQRDRSRVQTAAEAGATPVDAALQDDPGSAEAASDAVASGGLTAPIPVGQQRSGEAASDLVASGTTPAPGQVISFPFANARLRRAAARGRIEARSDPNTGQQSREGGGSRLGSPILAVPLGAAREIEDAFGPDRAPDQQPADPGAAAVQNATGLPDQREVAADLQAVTGLPSQRELTRNVNTAAEGAVGFRPRESAERGRQRARDTTLTVAAQAAQRAQDRPLAALAAGAPVAAAEPSPLGEAALVGGAAAGVIGIDLAGRIRERQSELERPDEPPSQRPGELPATEEPAVEREELETPSQAPESTQAELEVAAGELQTAELETPAPDSTDPLVLRTQQLIGRQRAREQQRRERRDDSIPERFIPDEEVTIGREQVEEPEVDGGRREFVDVERPEQGVRTFRQEDTEPQVSEQTQAAEPVAAGTVTGVATGAGLLSPVANRGRRETLVDVGLTPVNTLVGTGMDVGAGQQQAPQTQTQQRQRRDQVQRQRRGTRQVVEQRQRQRRQVAFPELQLTEPTGPGASPPTIQLRDRRRRPDTVSATEFDRAPGVQTGGAVDAGQPDLAPNAIGELIAAFGGVGAAGRRGSRSDPTAEDLAVGTVPVAANAREDEEFRAALEFFGGGGSAPVDGGEGGFFNFDVFGDDDQGGFL